MAKNQGEPPSLRDILPPELIEELEFIRDIKKQLADQDEEIRKRRAERGEKLGRAPRPHGTPKFLGARWNTRS